MKGTIMSQKETSLDKAMELLIMVRDFIDKVIQEVNEKN